MQPHVRSNTTVILVKNHADFGNKAVALWTLHMGGNKQSQKKIHQFLQQKLTVQNIGVGKSC